MDRFDAMKLFVRVAELGSFAAVAQQNGVARSMVTRPIAALEAHLGTKLILRNTRRLSLTSAGADYLERCRVILNLMEAAESGAAAERQTLRGPIRLSAPLHYGQRYVAPLLQEFIRTYPEVILDTDFIDRRSNLIEDGIDLAVRITRHLQATEVARRIGDSDMLVVASPDYLARHGDPVHPADLIHHQCLVYTGSAQNNHWDFDVDGHTRSFPIRARLLSGNGDFLLSSAAAGFGISLAPRFLAQDALASGTVRTTLTGFAAPRVGIYLMLPGNRHIPHRVRVLADFLVSRLGSP
jgi:DNA-binding transcriptional LysR family regulator